MYRRGSGVRPIPFSAVPVHCGILVLFWSVMTDTKTQNRSSEIIRYNLIGVAMNLTLSAMKLIAGSVFRSHAVFLDGINSLSDLVSETFSIAAAKLGTKSADPGHPFGYGRIEYVGSLIITMIIMYVGVTSIIDSISSILHPHEPPEYSVILIVIMMISLSAKLIYGLLMKKRGAELESAAMVMTGTESLGDSLVAVAVLVSYLIFRFTGNDYEHYLCVIISIMIINTGIAMVKECMNKIIGSPADPELRRELMRMLGTEEGVLNAANPVIHNYGEGVNVGSVDIDVDERLKVSEVNAMTHDIKKKAKELGVILTSVGVNGVPAASKEADEIWDAVIARVLNHKSILRAQSFSVDFEKKLIAFSVVENTAVKDRKEDLRHLSEELQADYPDMKIEIVIAANS